MVNCPSVEKNLTEILSFSKLIWQGRQTWHGMKKYTNRRSKKNTGGLLVGHSRNHHQFKDGMISINKIANQAHSE